MKFRPFLTAAFLVVLALFTVTAEAKTTEELFDDAVSSDPATAREAILALRALGPDSVTKTSGGRFANQIDAFMKYGVVTEEWKRIAFALDSIAMQKDAYASNLYWFTDLDEAKKEAAKTNKPILSLRLLGNLNEEFSCANSRFFRALLYSNTEISKYLRENYVLHWKSVRPAPRVTIDFGDGRKIERTITGNSIHYILDSRGDVIDALPGLYSPQDFLKYLASARDFEKTLWKTPANQRVNSILTYRRAQFNRIIGKRNQLIADSKLKLEEPKPGTVALEVAPRAITKMATEGSILRDISDDFSRFEPQIDLEEWRKLAKLYAGGTQFDAASVAFIKRQNAKNGLTDAQFASLLSTLTGYVSLDTTRNDFIFHTKLYQWLNAQQAREFNLESFNSRVYSELFKTPDADKWLGLYTTDVYTALDGNGIVEKLNN